MLSLGYCFCLQPFAKKKYRNEADRIHFLQRSLTYFNTHPYMANFIIGAVIRAELEKPPTTDGDAVQIDKYKTRLSSSLAAVGDEFFWSQLKPFCAMVGVLLVIYWQWFGLAVFLVLYNLPHLWARIYGLAAGYRLGFDVGKSVSMKKLHPVIDNLNKIGGIIAGSFVIFIGGSKFVSNNLDLVAFVSGFILMVGFTKLKLSIPVALLAILIFSMLIGVLFV